MEEKKRKTNGHRSLSLNVNIKQLLNMEKSDIAKACYIMHKNRAKPNSWLSLSHSDEARRRLKGTAYKTCPFVQVETVSSPSYNPNISARSFQARAIGRFHHLSIVIDTSQGTQRGKHKHLFQGNVTLLMLRA